MSSSNQRSKVILVVVLAIMFLVVVIFRSNIPAVTVLKSHILKQLNIQDPSLEVKPSVPLPVPVVDKVKSTVQNIPVLKFFSKTAKNMGDSIGKKIVSISNKKSQIVIQHPLDILNRLNKKLDTMKKSISKLLELIIHFPQLSGSLLFRFFFVAHNDTKPTASTKTSLEECTDTKTSKSSVSSSSRPSSSTKSKATASTNDHMSITFSALPATQQAMINEVTSSAVYKNKATVAAALESGIAMDEFLAFRYFAAIDWAPKYLGKR